MKLRIKGNSIRLRLGQSEVRRLAINGRVDEFTNFGPSVEERFGYTLCSSSEELRVSVIFSDGRIVVCVPTRVIHQWATTNQVSIQAMQRTTENDELRILIEKDFECMEASHGESQDDAFPNPHPSEEHSHAS